MFFLKSFSATALLVITFLICVKAEKITREEHVVSLTDNCKKTKYDNGETSIVQSNDGTRLTPSITKGNNSVYQIFGPFYGSAIRAPTSCSGTYCAGYFTTVITLINDETVGSAASLETYKNSSSKAAPVAIQYIDGSMSTFRGCSSIASCFPNRNCTNKYIACNSPNLSLKIVLCPSPS